MLQIKLTEVNKFQSGASIWHDNFKKMSLLEIENNVQDNLQSYAKVGYNSFTFFRPTNTVHIQKIDIKTLEDIFMTDQYGLLMD